MSRLLSKYPLTLTLWQRIAVVVEPNGSVVEGVGVQDLGAKSADIVGIEFVRVSDLRPNPANPRCNDSAVDAVARSIAAFGFNNPIITDGDLNIAAGHTRVKAKREATCA